MQSVVIFFLMFYKPQPSAATSMGNRLDPREKNSSRHFCQLSYILFNFIITNKPDGKLTGIANWEILIFSLEVLTCLRL